MLYRQQEPAADDTITVVQGANDLSVEPAVIKQAQDVEGDKPADIPAQAEPRLPAFELEQLEKMAAKGDIKGLVGVLEAGQWESKVKAANLLAEMGDLSAIDPLKELSKQWQGKEGENPFAQAVAMIEARCQPEKEVTLEGDSAMSSNEVSTVEETTAVVTSAPRQLLRLLPAETLFCVRVNNFDNTFSMADEFLVGISPMPGGMSMMARMQLAKMLGDAALSGIETTGNFAIIGLALPEEEEVKPAERLFTGFVFPVISYNAFVTGNANCGEADANGVSTITNPAAGKMLAAQMGDYALVANAGNYQKLVDARFLLASRSSSLQSCLDIQEAEKAATQPIWAYANIQLVSELFGPTVVGWFEEMQKQLEKQGGENAFGNPAAAIKMYLGAAAILMDEINYVTMNINAGAEFCSTEMCIAPLGDTLMSRAFAGSEQVENPLLGYLRDGAVLNLAMQMNTPFWEEWNLTGFDLISFMSDEQLPEDTIIEIQGLVSDMIDSAAGPAVVTFGIDDSNAPPFEYRQVVQVEDAGKWRAANYALMGIGDSNVSVLTDIYKTSLGIEMTYDINPAFDTYRDVPIDAVKLMVSPIDPNSDYPEEFVQIWGEGFNYRWATVDDLSLCASGGEEDAGIRELIDLAKAGGPDKLAAEMQAALKILNEAETADLVGTINSLRYMRMAGALMPGSNPAKFAFSNISTTTTSNIAFAARMNGGKMILEVALPKVHLQELKAGFTAMKNNMEQATRAREGEDPNNIVEATGFVGKESDVWHLTGPNKIRAESIIMLTQYPEDANTVIITLPYVDAELNAAMFNGEQLEYETMEQARYELMLPEGWGTVEKKKLGVEWTVSLDSLPTSEKGYRTTLRGLIPVEFLSLTLSLEEGCGFEFTKHPEKQQMQLFSGAMQYDKPFNASCGLAIGKKQNP